MENLTYPAKGLIELVSKNYQEKLSWQYQPKIQSREIVSFFAFLYERLRNFIDYQEEHLLRRRAIKRSLLRRFLFPQDPKVMARTLILEIIRARYLPNNVIPEEKILTVSQVIKRYLDLINTRQSERDFILSLAASEIEDILILDNEFLLLIFAYNILKEKYLVKDDLLLFIVLEEVLSRADKATICYHLLKLESPNFNLSSLNLEEFTKKIEKINEKVAQICALPEKEILSREIRKNIAPFVILRDLINQKPAELEKIFTDPNLLEKEVSEIANLRYKKTTSNLKTATIQSFIYIFLTKMIFAFLIEIPYDLYILGRLKILPLIINLLFPPTFMFLTTQTVKKPSLSNTKKIIQEIKGMIYQDQKINLPLVKIDLLGQLRPFLNTTFLILYSLTFIIVFGGVLWILAKLQFSLASIAVFFFFVSTVAFFAARIRRNFNDLIIAPQQEGFFTNLFNFFSYPFIRLGFVFSRALSQFNIFILIMDLLIEAPIKMFFELIEEWFAFIRQKEEEIVQ